MNTTISECGYRQSIPKPPAAPQSPVPPGWGRGCWQKEKHSGRGQRRWHRGSAAWWLGWRGHGRCTTRCRDRRYRPRRRHRYGKHQGRMPVERILCAAARATRRQGGQVTGHRNHFCGSSGPSTAAESDNHNSLAGQPECGIAVLAIAAAAQCALWRNPKSHIERMGGGVTGPH